MAGPNTGIYGHWGEYAAAGDLPNVAGSPLQTDELGKGDVAAVGDKLYICKTSTKGAGAWDEVGSGAPSPGTVPAVFLQELEQPFSSGVDSFFFPASPDVEELSEFTYAAGVLTYTGSTDFKALVTGGMDGAEQTPTTAQLFGFRINSNLPVPVSGVQGYSLGTNLFAGMSSAIVVTFTPGTTISMCGRISFAGGGSNRIVGSWMRIEAI